MIRLAAVVALCCAFAAPARGEAPPSPTSRPGAFGAEGRAAVVGGNVVSARKRALHRAQVAALESAARSLSPKIDASKLHALVGHLPRLLRTYRVLQEAQEGKTYQLIVEARFDLRRLRTLVGAASPAPPPTTAKARLLAVSLVVGGASSASLAKVLRQMVAGALASRLSAAGCSLRPGALASSRAAAIAAAPLASAVLELQVSADPAPGVRGLALPGATARWRVKLGTRAGVQLAAHEVRGWGRASTAVAAATQAARRGLRGLLAAIVPVLSKRFPASSAAPGQASIVLRGLSSLSRYQQIARRLRRAGYGVALRRLTGTEATISVARSELAPASRLLVGRAYRGFSLQREAGAGPPTFQARGAPAATGEGAPGS